MESSIRRLVLLGWILAINGFSSLPTQASEPVDELTERLSYYPSLQVELSEIEDKIGNGALEIVFEPIKIGSPCPACRASHRDWVNKATRDADKNKIALMTDGMDFLPETLVSKLHPHWQGLNHRIPYLFVNFLYQYDLLHRVLYDGLNLDAAALRVLIKEVIIGLTEGPNKDFWNSFIVTAIEKRMQAAPPTKKDFDRRWEATVKASALIKLLRPIANHTQFFTNEWFEENLNAIDANALGFDAILEVACEKLLEFAKAHAKQENIEVDFVPAEIALQFPGNLSLKIVDIKYRQQYQFPVQLKNILKYFISNAKIGRTVHVEMNAANVAAMAWSVRRSLSLSGGQRVSVKITEDFFTHVEHDNLFKSSRDELAAALSEIRILRSRLESK